MAVGVSRSRQITRKEVRGLFAKSFVAQVRNAIWPLVCEEIDVFSKSEFFATLGSVPQLQQTDDDTESDVQDFREYTYQFDNQLFSTSIRLKRSLLWFDQIKQTGTLLGSLATRVANFPDLRFITKLRAGTANAGLYGANFFDTNHALGGSAPATQSNIITGHTATADFEGVTTLRPALAQKIQTDFDLALVQLVTWQDDNGQPFYQTIDPKDLVILCGPKIFNTMKLALGARFIDQTDNIFQGVVGKILCSNYLPFAGAEAADWYLIHTNAPNKPMIYSRYVMRPDGMLQDKLKGEALEDAKRLSTVEIMSNIGSQEESVQTSKSYTVTANFLGEVTYGAPQTIIKVDNAAS